MQARSSSDPWCRYFARLTAAGLPRGGGDGDAIRHGILNVMRENGIKEGHRPVRAAALLSLALLEPGFAAWPQLHLCGRMASRMVQTAVLLCKLRGMPNIIASEVSAGLSVCMFAVPNSACTLWHQTGEKHEGGSHAAEG